ncbi:MAG: NAD(P)H-dependent oxidoreductase [Butyricicoccus sp.]|nr:NAD(P)H-dependent oxidoreductase [Butyricicoccus sp.]
MKLILSDRPLQLPEIDPAEVKFIDLSQLKIANCVGCFGCWTKTPGKCVIRDDAVRVYPLIAASDHVLYISRIHYGSYDTTMKTMLERAIPVQQAFIRLVQGETHHVQRRVQSKKALILGYGDTSQESQDIFRQLIARNAKNMSFESYRVLFAAEEDVEQIVRKEVLAWAKS